MKRACVIPARGGSVRLPRKNILPFAGRPIISYSIDCAKESGLFDWIVVSTDDDEIGEISEQYGATMLHRRPPRDDGSMGTQEVARNAVLDLELDPFYVCCLYATAPLVLPKHLHAGLSVLIQRDAAYSMAVGTEPLRDAGAMYWSRWDALLDNVPLIGPRTVMVPLPENRVCDINTEEDFRKAEEMYAAQR